MFRIRISDPKDTPFVRTLHMSTISIIGAGGMAAAIAGRAVQAGYTVEVTSRDGAKAQALAERLGPGASTSTYAGALAGDLVILAVPYSAALEVVAQYGEHLAGKILVDITNPVAPDYTSFVTPADSSGAMEISRAAPATTDIVKAFNTHFSHAIARGSFKGRPLDVPVAGDNASAKRHVASFIERLGFIPLDAGNLAMARTLEHACLLSLGLMRHSLKHTNFAIGIEAFP
jgi:predicted dinucleotide-binding enzyme